MPWKPTCCCASDVAGSQNDKIEVLTGFSALNEQEVVEGVIKEAEAKPAAKEDPPIFTAVAQGWDEPVPQATSPPDFSGAWQDKTNSVYILRGSIVKWSSQEGHESALKYSGNQVQMVDSDLVGTLLQANASQLRWSDGETWNRAGFDGYWQMGTGASIYQINGAMLTTYQIDKVDKSYLNPSCTGKSWCNDLELVSPTLIKLVLDEQESITGTVDQTGLSLTWSDNDVWIRTFDNGGFVETPPEAVQSAAPKGKDKSNDKISAKLQAHIDQQKAEDRANQRCKERKAPATPPGYAVK